MPLGIQGFTYADLHEPARLRELTTSSVATWQRANPAFWAEWDAYRQAPDAPRSPLERVGPASCAWRRTSAASSTTLFGVDAAAAGLADGTHELDPLFRFKVDFVRKRSLPLRQGRRARPPRSRPTSPSSTSSPSRGRISIASGRLPRPAAICSTARPLPAPPAPRRTRRAVTAQIDALQALVRLLPARSRLSPWVIFRFPETVDYQNLVQVQRPRADLPEAMLGPDDRLRRRDGFTLTDSRWTHARGAERDRLLHALPRARQGLLLEGAARQGRRRSSRTRSASR